MSEKRSSPDSDTIERVAAALAKQDEYDDWNGLTERSQRHYRDAAKVAIAAISAPAQAAPATDWRLRALRAEAEIDRLLTQPQAARPAREAIDAAQKRIMTFPYFSEDEALEIAEVAIETILSTAPQAAQDPLTIRLNDLRLKAFKSNFETDRNAYFDALSLAFQRGELIASLSSQSRE